MATSSVASSRHRSRGVRGQRDPVTGKPFTRYAQSTEADVEAALDAAHKAAPAWGESSLAQRAIVLNKIADAVEEHLEEIALAETYDNGKAIRETLNADIPLLVDHFRYFAGAARAEEGTLTEIDADMVAYHFREPLGVVGQIIPFNFPLLMAAWKLAPALAAGNAVVLKPASPTPWSIMKLMEVIATSSRRGSSTSSPDPAPRSEGFGDQQAHRQDRVHRETVTGRLIMQYAHRTSSRAPQSWAVRARTSSSATSWPRTTRSSTRPLRVWCCTRSTRAKSARVRRAP